MNDHFLLSVAFITGHSSFQQFISLVKHFTKQSSSLSFYFIMKSQVQFMCMRTHNYITFIRTLATIIFAKLCVTSVSYIYSTLNVGMASKNMTVH